MKFGRYLEDNAQPEWKRVYLDYKGLKKLIKQVHSRRTARIAAQRKAAAAAAAFAPPQKRWSALRRASLFITGRGSSGEQQPLLPSTPLSGGTQSPGASSYFSIGVPTPSLQTTANVPVDLPTIDVAKTRMNINESVCSVALHPPVSIAGDDSATAATWRSILSNALQQQHTSRGHSKLAQQAPPLSSVTEAASSTLPSSDGPPTLTPQFFAEPDPQMDTDPDQATQRYLDMVDANFDYPERILLAALDSELAKISTFYLEREAEFEARFAMIARQLRELVDHRRAWKAHEQEHHYLDQVRNLVEEFVPLYRSPRNEAAPGAKNGYNSPTNQNPGALTATPSPHQQTQPRLGPSARPSVRRRTTLYDEEERRWVAALDNMPSSVAQRIIAEDERTRSDNVAAVQSRDPEAYLVAAKKLKKALIESYRSLCILQNFLILNRTGFVKILKKSSKAFDIRDLSDTYHAARVEPSPLYTSHKVKVLLASAEELFTAYFEQGDRKKALTRLRSVTGGTDAITKTHYASVFRAGVATGLAVISTWDAVENSLEIPVSLRNRDWELLWRVYSAFYLPATFGFLFGLCRLSFQHFRVNAPFIFQWDPRSTLDPHQAFELPAWILFTLALTARMSFPDPDEPGSPPILPPTAWPGIWLLGMLVFLIWPTRILWYDTRRWLVYAVLRVLSGGMIPTTKYAVQFADFVLGDIGTSLTFSLSTLWLMQCQYRCHGWNWSHSDTATCDPNTTRWTMLLSMLPPVLRLTQCFRRWVDSHQSVHLVNGGKYSVSILNAYAYGRWRWLGSGKDGIVFWVITATMNSTYSGSWDVLLDWSLGKTRPGVGPDGRTLPPGLKRFHYLLRADLMYQEYWPIYYWAMINDLVLRVSWLLYLVPLPSALSSGLMRTLMVAWLEMLRRWQWMFIRVENEHLGNADRYRATVDMPLPYDMAPAQEEDKQTASAIAHSPKDDADSGSDDDENDDGPIGGSTAVRADVEADPGLRARTS